jgi:hypothetical protein
MAEETQKTPESTTVRIYGKTKGRLKKVVRKIADQEDRDVTELEIADELLNEGLQKRERKLGIEQ